MLLLSWWYSAGYRDFLQKLLSKLHDTADFFSIDLLLKTLFSPYKQISAEVNSGSFFQRLLDKLISRIIGFFIRFFIIIIGTLALISQSILSLFAALSWPLLPIFPLICFVLFAGGTSL
ncbi:MAG: hypothetical protein Q4F60_02305 [Candidatus Saccharibacteria bacterium]|nr:hypothetical protein [Candidatus Saccharibacteria bacterium]